MYTQVYHGAMQKYLIFDLAKYLKIPIRYCFLEIVSKIKIKILRPLYLLYLSLLYLRYSPTLTHCNNIHCEVRFSETQSYSNVRHLSRFNECAGSSGDTNSLPKIIYSFVQFYS